MCSSIPCTHPRQAAKSLGGCFNVQIRAAKMKGFIYGSTRLHVASRGL